MFDSCLFTDERKAREFVKRHQLTSASQCIRTIQTVHPKLDAVKETFLIGLNGFPNKMKGKLSDGNVVVFNWMIAQCHEEHLVSTDDVRTSEIASEICSSLRIYGNTKNLVSAVLACLERNENQMQEMREMVAESESSGVRVINPGKFYSLRKTIRQDANASVKRKGEKPPYQVRRYDTQHDMEEYLQGPVRQELVFVSTDGKLTSADLDSREFLKGLLWIIRSEWFTKKDWPNGKGPYYVYSAYTSDE